MADPLRHTRKPQKRKSPFTYSRASEDILTILRRQAHGREYKYTVSVSAGSADPKPPLLSLNDAHCHLSAQLGIQSRDSATIPDQFRQLVAKIKLCSTHPPLYLNPTRAKPPDFRFRFRSRFTVMSTNTWDLPLIAELFRAISDPSNPSDPAIVPAFGIHPWYSHLISLKPPNCLPSKESHYSAILVPVSKRSRGNSEAELAETSELSELISRLPDPVSVETVAQQIRHFASEFSATRCLIGEIGLDKLFRVPSAGFYTGSNEVETGGAALTNYTVSLPHQAAVLRVFLTVAWELGLSVSIHGVGCHGKLFEEVCGVLREKSEAFCGSGSGSGRGKGGKEAQNGGKSVKSRNTVNQGSTNAGDTGEDDGTQRNGGNDRETKKSGEEEISENSGIGSHKTKDCGGSLNRKIPAESSANLLKIENLMAKSHINSVESGENAKITNTEISGKADDPLGNYPISTNTNKSSELPESPSAPHISAIALHSFSGSVDQAKQYIRQIEQLWRSGLEVRLFFSLSHVFNVAKYQKVKKVAELIAALPDECLLIETDFPLDVALPLDFADPVATVAQPMTEWEAEMGFVDPFEEAELNFEVPKGAEGAEKTEKAELKHSVPFRTEQYKLLQMLQIICTVKGWTLQHGAEIIERNWQLYTEKRWPMK